MTLLRSRAVLPDLNSKTKQPQAKESAVLEPVTPLKTSELLSQSSISTTPSSSLAVENFEGRELLSGSGRVGSVIVGESGSEQRRSARLASKVGSDGNWGSFGIVCGRKKRKVEGSALNGEFDARNLGGHGSDTSVNGGNLQNLNDRDVTELAINMEGVRNEGTVPKLGMNNGSTTMGSETVNNGRQKRKSSMVANGVKNERIMPKLGKDDGKKTSGTKTVNNGNSKRKSSMKAESLSFESCGKGKEHNRLLSLRSGKRVVKGGKKDCSGADNVMEDIENGKNTRSVLSLKEEKKDCSSACNGMDDIENGRRTSSVLRSDTLLVSSLESGTITDGLEEGKSTVLSSDDLSKTSSGSETSIKELKEKKTSTVSRRDLLETSSDSESEKSIEELAGKTTSTVLRKDDISQTSSDDSSSDSLSLPESADSKVLINDKGGIATHTGVKTRGRFSKEEKGKMKLGVTDSSSMGRNTANHKGKNREGGISSAGTSQSAANEPLRARVQVRETDVTANDARMAYRERFRRAAKRNASRFAHFVSGQEFGDDTPDGRDTSLHKTDDKIEDWPGPFSTAMKIIRDRATTNKHGDWRSSSSDKTEAVELKWIPKTQELGKQQKQVPSLQELCWPILSKNADAITSFDFVPVVLRHKICWCLCDGRRMDGHIFNMLTQDSPTEIRVRDCSWLSEDLFTKAFEHCDTSKLMVLQLDQGGSCMPDYILHGTLACSPNKLPALTTISLKAAYRLSDAGLSMLVSCAPSLKSVNVSQCPLLTAEGISSLANCQRSILRELYLDECQGVDAILMLPALLNLEKLEVLSVAGISTVCDDFVIAFSIAHGLKIKELGLADCTELTDFSLKAIGDRCSELRAIDLTNLRKLTDFSIGHLANGCHGIWKLKLGRNGFSDEAITAYLDLRGAGLQDLTLNNVIQVSNHTALSLARNCRILRNLDLSWCRNVTNEALGLIVDSCLSLELLKLFGCTQISKVFLDGHSNPRVKIIGLKMTPLLKHIDVPDFLLGPLRYSSY